MHPSQLRMILAHNMSRHPEAAKAQRHVKNSSPNEFLTEASVFLATKPGLPASVQPPDLVS